MVGLQDGYVCIYMYLYGDLVVVKRDLATNQANVQRLWENLEARGSGEVELLLAFYVHVCESGSEM